MKNQLTLNKDKTNIAVLNMKENFMKHILKTTAIGGISVLCCFALEAMEMDQNSISLDGTSQDGRVFTMTIRPSEFTTTIRPTDNIGNFFFELLRSSNVDLKLPSSNDDSTFVVS